MFVYQDLDQCQFHLGCIHRSYPLSMLATFQLGTDYKKRHQKVNTNQLNNLNKLLGQLVHYTYYLGMFGTVMIQYPVHKFLPGRIHRKYYQLERIVL